MDDIAIRVEHVSKIFKLPHEKNTSIKSAVVNFYRRNKSFEMQKALRGISFDVKKGEFFGIVGRNGSGKSTLLKLLAGIYTATAGAVAVNGSLTPFIELGVGFNPELTGRENVYLNGALLGFSRKEMQAMYDSIVEFAELEKFMDQKLKNYSSGMQVRLAFSIAIRAKSDILLIDEVLAVGDAIFQKKCYDYFKRLKKEQKTVIFVSHDIGAMKEYCTNGVWIDSGKIVSRGSINKVTHDYLDFLNTTEEATSRQEKQRKQNLKNEKRWGNGDVAVITCETSSEPGKARSVFTDKDQSIFIDVLYKVSAKVSAPVLGITISDASGENIFASNTLWSKIPSRDVEKGELISVQWKLPNAINSGNFYIAPAAADKLGTTIYDWREQFTEFKIRKELLSPGYVNVEHDIVLEYSKPRKK